MGHGKKNHGHHLENQHPSLHYHMTYSSHHEAMSCWHVQTAAKHHGVCLIKLAKLLAGGISLISAVASLVVLL
ncbi:unnamed protein product [Calypogeia fissa]